MREATTAPLGKRGEINSLVFLDMPVADYLSSTGWEGNLEQGFVRLTSRGSAPV